MHPVVSDRLSFSLPGRQGESSFPERHIWAEADDASHESLHVAFEQPGFPKLDFGPGVSSFWQQNWLAQSQALHRHQVPAIERLTSVEDQHPAHNDLLVSSPSHHEAPEWGLFRAGAVPGADFPWLPPYHQPQQLSSPKIKADDDSDSNWSLNDNSSEDLQILPQLVRSQAPSTARRRRGTGSGVGGTSSSRVSKASSRRQQNQPSTPTMQTAAAAATYRHTFRMSKVAAPETIDLSGAGESPDDFAAKMLERRIAHKLSEKSRRNRLTAAIREMQKLMPLEDQVGPEGDAAATVQVGLYPHFSKVDVAEMAIGYIRKLQRENEALRVEVERYRGQEQQEDGHDDGVNKDGEELKNGNKEEGQAESVKE
ncbi:hypothetical protein QBC47DRAFT_191060 [Echria macrotheca]|uniref:BHLH domain-containing protein n=1 Tax=Echria macrotheca TaxID=438768 RepID=A0AAJ0BEC1_9PEZI|nr:hypothetical protein QBC47DRAFT_191060 [Echria macrotheca]